MISTEKGANNAKRTTVAKARPKAVAAGKASPANRKGAASIPVGTKPVRYRFTAAEREAILEGSRPARGSATEPGAESAPQASYQGPDLKTVTRFAAIGLVLIGFVIGCVVGKRWL